MDTNHCRTRGDSRVGEGLYGGIEIKRYDMNFDSERISFRYRLCTMPRGGRGGGFPMDFERYTY